MFPNFANQQLVFAPVPFCDQFLDRDYAKVAPNKPYMANRNYLAEVDGNRTRRTRITRSTRFEGEGAHQVPGHLHPST